MDKLINGYLSFLDNGKTERRCAIEIIKQAEEAGMIVLDIDLTEFKAAAAPFCTQFPLGQEVLDTLKDIPA